MPHTARMGREAPPPLQEEGGPATVAGARAEPRPRAGRGAPPGGGSPRCASASGARLSRRAALGDPPARVHGNPASRWASAPAMVFAMAATTVINPAPTIRVFMGTMSFRQGGRGSRRPPPGGMVAYATWVVSGDPNIRASRARVFVACARWFWA